MRFAFAPSAERKPSVRPKPDLLEPTSVLRCVAQVPGTDALELAPALAGVGVELSEEPSEAQGPGERMRFGGSLRLGLLPQPGGFVAGRLGR